MDKVKLLNEFTDAVEYMKRTKFNGTYYWVLGEDDDYNNWAIVLGWADGFEADETDDCLDGTWRLCVKLAYQSWNNISQCDYDWDWTMPFDEDSGEVDDTEISIYPNNDFEETIDWLLDRYTSYEIEWGNHNEEIE